MSEKEAFARSTNLCKFCFFPGKNVADVHLQMTCSWICQITWVMCWCEQIQVNFCVLRLIMLIWPVLARPQRKNICANWNASSVTWTFQEMASFQRRSSQTCCRTFAMCDLCLRPVILSYRQYTLCAHVTWWTCSGLGFVCNATTKAWNEQHVFFVFELSHLILHEMCFFHVFFPWSLNNWSC